MSSYWLMRETNKERAKKHINMLYSSNELMASIESSVLNTKVYRIFADTPPTPKTHVQHIKVLPTDTVSAIMDLDVESGKVAVLNFADYRYAGGLFTSGSGAQEECLCHESTLYPVLSVMEDYYTCNSLYVNKHLYTNAALYSKDILFMRNGVTKSVDVITCAAPNWSRAKKLGASYTDNCHTLRDRIEFVIQVAANNAVDTLILGAWGCGVFGQDAKVVAEYFQNTIEDYPFFKNIIFAVPKGYNLDAFKNVFD